MRTRLLAFLVIAAVACAGAFLWTQRFRTPEGLSRRAIEIGDRSVVMLVMRLPAGPWEYAFAADPSNPKTVRQWREELGAEIAFNGSYFTEDGTPSGYWKTGKGTSAVPWPSLEEQRDSHGYTFALSVANDGLHLRYLPSDPISEPVDETFLSFPTLLADGVAMVEEDSGLRARRTAVAEDADGADYLVVTEEGSLTLYELARWLDEQPEGFVVAGNLDGGPSTGVSITNNGRNIEVPSVEVPNAIVISSARFP